jgi:hypothetical protein
VLCSTLLLELSIHFVMQVLLSMFVGAIALSMSESLEIMNEERKEKLARRDREQERKILARHQLLRERTGVREMLESSVGENGDTSALLSKLIAIIRVQARMRGALARARQRLEAKNCLTGLSSQQVTLATATVQKQVKRKEVTKRTRSSMAPKVLNKLDTVTLHNDEKRFRVTLRTILGLELDEGDLHEETYPSGYHRTTSYRRCARGS